MSDTSPIHGRQLVASFTDEDVPVRIFSVTKGCENPECESCKNLAAAESFVVFAKPTPDEDEWCVALWSQGRDLDAVVSLWHEQYGSELDRWRKSLAKLAAVVGATWSEVVAKTQEVTFCQATFADRAEQTGLSAMLAASSLSELRAIRAQADPYEKGALAAPLIARALGWDDYTPPTEDDE